jgi:succinoglycan biosynthesis transport protein ExoP
VNDEQQRSPGFDSGEHFRIIWRARVPVLLASLAVAAVVYVWSSERDATYEATATMSVDLRTTAQGRAAEEDASFAASRYAALAMTQPVLEDSIRSASLDLEPEELEASLSVDANSTPGFLSVTASSERPDDAAAIAAAVAATIVATAEDMSVADVAAELRALETELSEVEAALENRTGGATAVLQTRYEALVLAIAERRREPQDSLRVVSPPTIPSDPATPTPSRDAALAFIVALVVNGELAVARRFLGNRIARGGDIRREVEDATGLPVLALLPSARGTAADEAFRELRTNLAFLTPTDGCRSVAVTSDDAATGTTSVAVGLATASAIGDRRVVLVDADLRQPSVHSRMGVAIGTGLGEVLTATALVSDVMHRVPTPNGHVFVLTAGGAVADPAYALSSGFADRVLTAVEDAGSLVVVDGPPAAMVADGLVVAAACDLTLIVVDARSTRREAVTELVRRLRQVGAKPVGVVVDHAPAEAGPGRRQALGSRSRAPVATAALTPAGAARRRFGGVPSTPI